MSKLSRLSKIFNEDGKSITLALDGYYFSPKTAGIDNTISRLPELVSHGLDCTLATYGMINHFQSLFNKTHYVLRVDASANVYDNTVPDTQYLYSVSDALKLGADGVVCMTFPGAFNEEKTHQMAVSLTQQCATWNMPLIVEALPFGYPVSSPESNQPAIIATAARMAEELGADVVKTRFSGTDDDALITAATQVPVLALGGPKTGIQGYFQFVKHCIDCGAKGVAVGRNITQDPNPVGVVAGLNVIIHQNGTAQQALDVYQSSK